MPTTNAARLATALLALGALAAGIGAHVRADADPPPATDAARGRSAPVPLEGAPGSIYDWPLGGPPPDVVRRFEPPPAPWAAGHRGVDLAAAQGTAVLAASDGVVAFAGTVADRGVVSVDHADGIRTTYEPLAPTVPAGERVARGDVVGILQSGHAEVPCLHWGARRGSDDYLDPLTLVGEPPVIRLYPSSG
ncbi:Peptidase M23 [Beutenbergia cavernae DSM 12333]|uniref:Peptidase M23 n=1 Tax=Beutenbergia cavernae (strain ATCC BAA-8 / DSM 12333 / CCUG 43141 / JCM 11478 / NBRC 16432 / NCIMB 13614 / HKI 0122) TaxID=471853 RepID=C5BWU2_BEUC1|nr:M23 family metallopeptidase [Beutenbergia cavernae]ACQ80758.1 Peptidase M23 [Beutenbergia cavernae DSM 12333]